MCRFVFYIGPRISLGALLTEPAHSLIKQSIHARERHEPLNGDGFGVAWYEPEVRSEPVLFKEVSPAWNSLNLNSLAPVSRSHCILAHVRAATAGLAVTQLNCHPFSRGDYSFMHNGHVPAFEQVRRPLLARLSDAQFNAIQSTGDTEVLLGLAMDALAGETGLEAMGGALLAAIAIAEEQAEAAGAKAPAYLNLVLSDGRDTAITRYVTPGQHRAETLYLNRGGRYVCRRDHCRMVDDLPEHEPGAVLVASEPLSVDDGWESVPANTLLLIGGDRTVSQRPIKPVRRLN